MKDNHIYLVDDNYGYYGKGLWYDFDAQNEALADIIVKLCLTYTDSTSTDPILKSSAHVEHKFYRIACLLGLAEWPDV